MVAALYREWYDLAGFLVTLLLTLLIGTLMRRAGRSGAPTAADVERIRRGEGLAIVASTWLVVAMLAGIPYVWIGFAPVDAMFESMSGLTTTGAKVFTDF